MKVRRAALFLAGLVAAGVVVAALLGQWAATPHITEEQVDKIQAGMTLEQVEAVLGCRPGNYTPREYFLPVDMSLQDRKKQEIRAPYKEWAADTADPRSARGNGPELRDAIAVRVWFDEHGRVIDKCRTGYSYTAPPADGWFKRWLRR